MDDGDFVGDSEEEHEEQEETAEVSTGETTTALVAAAPHEDPPRENELVDSGVAHHSDPIERSDGALDSAAAGVENDVLVDHNTLGDREEAPVERAPEPSVVRREERLSLGGADAAPQAQATDLLAKAPQETEPEVADSGPRAKFKVGDIVHVASRTWPGINKLGGAGKIASVITDVTGADGGMEFLYNVKYMLGGFEKRIEEEFIQDLQDALATGVRQHKERVFYHDEYAKDPHKKQKSAVTEFAPIDFAPQVQDKRDETTPEKGMNGTQLPKKGSKSKKTEGTREKVVLVDAPEIEYRARSSDDSDYDEPDDPASDDQGHPRRIDDDSFIFDERRSTVTQRKRSRDSKKKASKSHEGEERPKPKRRHREAEGSDTAGVRARKKRSHRIIESDEEYEGEGKDRADDISPTRNRSKHRRRSKKRRYIGGYEHGTEDAEGSFIQPEGNPAELPDDVVKELKFRLGTSKAELRTQLESVADRLLENLGEFEDRKSDLASRLELSAALDEIELQDMNRKLLELGEFVRTKFIRSGEDVMNLIIKMLEKKGASLPDRIDLQFENWKQRVAEHDVWVKQSLRALENTFNRRGFSEAFRDDVPRAEETSSESGSSSDSDRSESDDFEMLDDEPPSHESAPTPLPPFDGNHPKRYTRRKGTASDTMFSEPSSLRLASRKRPRTAVQVQSSLDGFAVPFDEIAHQERFREPRALVSSNFRFVRGSDDKILKDPRWDWARTLSRKHVKSSVPARQRPMFASLSHPRPSVGEKGKPLQKSESVMEAVLRLRDKRFRDRSTRPNTFPQGGQVHSSFHGAPITQRNALASRSRTPIVEGYAGIGDHKKSRVPVDPESDSMSLVEREPRKWSNIFAVLSAQESIPTLQTATTTCFAPLGDLPQAVDEGEELLLTSLHAKLSPTLIVQRASAIRQTLALLRLMEREAMDRILTERNHPGSELSFAQSDSWRAVVLLGDDYHSELAAFMESFRLGLRGIHSTEVNAILHSTVTELSYLLKQVPDCITTFGDSPSYAYFFEVAAPGSRASPLITAICRTYWYSVQVLICLKESCERDWSESRKDWSPIVEDSLPLNRVALAACLFLIDLYIHIPSTHRFLSDGDTIDGEAKVEAPALALWQWLFEMFASGAIQSNKNGETSSLWYLLQTAYKQGMIDLVGIGYMKRQSFGGYIRESAPPKVLGSDEELQGMLLAADVLWDMSCLLASLLHPVANSKPVVLSTSWNLAKQLLSTNMAGFVPLNSLSQYDSLDDEFQLQSHGFKLRVLRRLLVLSAIWPPDNDIVESLFQHLWDSVQEEEDQALLSSIIDFIGEVRQLSDRNDENSRHNVAHEHATRTTNSVELFCKIAVMQLSKLEKAIHRVRFRQPVLRAISAHIDKHKSSLAMVAKPSEETVTVSAMANAKGGTKTWNWTKGSKGGRSDTAAAQTVKTHTPPQTNTPSSMTQQVVVEVNSILSIVMMFGLSTVYLDDEASAQQQSARRKRELKREIDFFCKELSSVSCDVPETSSRLCECLSAVGTAAIDAGVSYSTPFERLDSLLRWSIDQLQQARQAQSDQNKSNVSTHTKLLTGVASSCLRALRDLSTQLLRQLEVRSHDEPDEVETCINSALGSGLAAAIDSVVDGVLGSSDLDLGIAILMIWMPKIDTPPTHSLQFVPSTTQNPPGEFDEFDEFDDPEMINLLATVDLGAGAPSTSSLSSSIRSLQDRARAVALSSVRLSVLKILPSFPQKRWRSYQEVYMIDLMGSMIATCKFPFNWVSVSLPSLKPRMFAPRLMGSILQHRGDSDWLSTSFMSEQNADVELSSLWLTATLDLRSLFPTVSKFRASALPPGNSCEGEFDSLSETVKYSSYWLSLTDGILTKLLKEDPVVRYKMDQLIYQLLHRTATQCSYGRMIRECPDPRDVGSLYSMHVDVFRAFCQSAGLIWQSLTRDQSRHRQDMNRFRTKMMDTQRGVFVSLPEAYNINLRAVCEDLDRKKINWYSLSSRFLDEFSATTGTMSLHAVDDATSILDRELADPAIRPLIILFKFMYDCVDSFLFNCGEMAIGQRNLFYAILKLMFRQARTAEFPVAERRLRQANPSSHSGMAMTTPSTATTLSGISSACVAFTESVRLFFAYQKYPSLMNWFAQNLEAYQTLKGGWTTSPLRVLLYNVFDPHGPLGIHSYYPIQDDSRSNFDPRLIRREAFYFACGLLYCRCSRSYEHTRCIPQLDQGLRRSQLRRFILTDFVKELSIATVAECDNMDESLLPYFQLVKAFLNHLNLDGGANLRTQESEAAICVEQDLLPCLVFVGEYLVRILGGDDMIDDTISCVVLMEFVCIVEEVILSNHELQHAALQQFVGIGLRCAGYAYSALGRFSSAPLEQAFADEFRFGWEDTLNELAALKASITRYAVNIEPGLADMKPEPSHTQQRGQDDYGIGKARVRSDLLAAIRRLVKTCNDHNGHPLVRRAPSSHVAEYQVPSAQSDPLAHESVDGTM